MDKKYSIEEIKTAIKVAFLKAKIKHRYHWEQELNQKQLLLYLKTDSQFDYDNNRAFLTGERQLSVRMDCAVMQG